MKTEICATGSLLAAESALGRFDDLPALFDEVETSAALVGWSGVAAMTAAPYAEVLLAEGREHEGVAMLARARELTRHWSPGQPAVHLADAWFARARHDRAGAEAALHAALADARRAGMQLHALDALEGLGGAAVARGAVADGVRIVGAAHGLRRPIGAVALPHRAEQCGRDLDAARAAIGDDEVEAAWAEGAAMSADAAFAYASRGRGERKRPALGWDSLTPAECKVVELVAAGLSNPEIASRLFISRRTVSTHLTHVFEKLGVRSRAELAAAAARRTV